MQEQYIHITEDGDKFYYKDKAKTILHRLDGPAFEYSNGYKEWNVDGKLHRTDGPAIEYPYGGKAWYINDVFIFRLNSKGEMTDRMR